MPKQEMMQSGEALEIEDVASVELHAGSDTAYAISMTGAVPVIPQMHEQEPDHRKHGKRQPQPRQETSYEEDPPAVGNKGVEERRYKKGILVEGKLLSDVHQAGEIGKGCVQRMSFR